MATLPKMIEAIQPLDGRDLSTLTQFGRVLREAGYIPAGKRGKGAPLMGLDHTTNLLLGIYGANSPKDGPSAVSRFRRLERGRCEGPFSETCAVLKDVEKLETLGEVLEELIIGLPELVTSICNLMGNGKPLSDDQMEQWFQMTANGMGPADLRVTLHPALATIEVHKANLPIWFAQFEVNADLFMDGEYNAVLNSDRKVSYTFSIRTLTAFHMALMDGLDQRNAKAAKQQENQDPENS